jgi:hypothetical protein
MSGSAPQRTPALREAVALAGVLLLGCAFFWKAALLRGVFFHYDHAIQNFPYREFFAEGLRQGRLRLWTPDIFCGFPLFAESQGNALYPGFLALFSVLKPWVAYNWYTIAHFLLAGAAAYLLARVVNVGRAGAVLAGVCYMLAAPVLNHAHHTNIVVAASWLPLLLALMELACRRGSAAAILVFAGATGAMLLGAQPQYALYGALVCGLYLVWRLRLTELTGGRVGTVVALGAAFGMAAGLGALLAAGQLLPTLQLVAHSSRAGASMSLPTVSPGVPGNLMTLLLPHYFGSPGLASYWGDLEPGLYAELTFFMGIAPLMLAVVGAVADRRRAALFFAGLGTFAFLFAMGFSGSLYDAFALLPVFRTARFPSRFAYVTALCVAMLAGMGLEQLLSGADRRRVARAAVASAAVTLLLSAVALWVVAAVQRPFMGLSRDELSGAMPHLPAYAVGLMWRHLHVTLPADVWRLTVAAGVGAVLLLLCARRALPAWLAVAAWVGLAFGDLAWSGREFAVVTDPAVYLDEPPLARALHELPEGRIVRYRYYERGEVGERAGLFPFSRGWALHPDRFAQCLDRLPHNANMLWHIPSVNGFSPLQVQALRTLLGQPDTTATLVEVELNPVLNLLNARYILTPRRELPPPLRPLRTVSGVTIYENPAALPRAFIVHTAQAAPSDEAAAFLLRGKTFDPSRTVLVHDAPGKPASFPPGRAEAGESARVVRDDGDAVLISAALERPGYLVLADQHYPGWTVRVDGAPAPLLRVNYALKGVLLGPGTHAVVFEFRPAAFRAGMALTLAAALLLAAGMVACLVRRKRPLRVCAPEEARLLEQPYRPAAARLLIWTALVFLALGPALHPVHWRTARLQVDPRRYAVKMAATTVSYLTADERFVDGYLLFSEVCRWWPQDFVARRQLVHYALMAAQEMMDVGREDEAKRIARAMMQFAPEETRQLAPALEVLAR